MPLREKVTKFDHASNRNICNAISYLIITDSASAEQHSREFIVVENVLLARSSKTVLSLPKLHRI